MITVFSNPNVTKTEETESQKVSSWLEKLFKQRERKIEDEKKEKFSANQRTSPANVYPGEIKTALQSQAEEETIQEEKGQGEAAKNHFRKIGTDQHRLDDMMAKSNRIIISISSMFPWDFFPDSINVEETRVTIIQRQLFASQVHSVDIKNISNVFIDEDIFFAALTIVSRTFEENNITIMKLRKKEADLTRRLIEGLRMFIEKDIDTSKYTTEELISKLKALSMTKTVF
jgi:hypothetical protein